MRRSVGIIAAAFVALILFASCGATQKERDVTYSNRQKINEAIPVPDISYSSRRWVLAQFYSQVLGQPRLRTCTVITSRGANATGQDILAVAETIGVPVNLSNQMTDPSISEPDSIYTGPNDQTVVVLRNGIGIITEADTTAITGDCPEGIKPKTTMQQIIDYQQSQPPGKTGVNFLPKAP